MVLYRNCKLAQVVHRRSGLRAQEQKTKYRRIDWRAGMSFIISTYASPLHQTWGFFLLDTRGMPLHLFSNLLVQLWLSFPNASFHNAVLLFLLPNCRLYRSKQFFVINLSSFFLCFGSLSHVKSSLPTLPTLLCLAQSKRMQNLTKIYLNDRQLRRAMSQPSWRWLFYSNFMKTSKFCFDCECCKTKYNELQYFSN